MTRTHDLLITNQLLYRLSYISLSIHDMVFLERHIQNRIYFIIFFDRRQQILLISCHTLSIIIKRTETQLSRLCVFSLLQPHRTEVRLTGKYRYLTFEDRKKIEAWHLLGDRPVDIAARLSVHHTTIYKELQRGATGALDANQREGYSAELAERRLRESFKRRGKRAPAAQ